MPLVDALLLDPAPFQVWVAVRSDGSKGSGTLSDPFDGGSDRFDALLNLFENESNVTIHLGPGEYQTKGYGGTGGWEARPGFKIIGSGMDATKITLMPGTSEVHYFAIGHSLETLADSFEISELTIDCNLGASGVTGACGGVRVMGNHARIRRVKVKNWGTKTADVPCFALSLITAYPDTGPLQVDDAGIEGCYVVEPHASNAGPATALNVGSQDEIEFDIEGQGNAPFIRRCFVDCGLPTPSVENPKLRGISIGWSRGGVVEDNHIHNADIAGPYQDKRSIRDVIVRNNFCKNVGIGIQFKLGLFGDVFELADISETPPGSKIAIAVVDGPSHGLSVGDRVRIEPDGGGPLAFRGVFLVTEVPDETTFKFRLLSSPGSSNAASAHRVMGVGRAIIEGNVMELAPGVTGVRAMSITDDNDSSPYDETPDYVHGDVIIRNNKIRYVDGLPPDDSDTTLIEAQGVKNLIVQNNVLDTISALPLQNTRCAHATYFNNRTPAGKLIQGYNEEALNRYSELETDAEDAFVLAFLQKG